MFHTLLMAIVASLILQDVNCLWRKWISWTPADITFGTPVVLQGSFSVTECLAKCGQSPSCVSAHVNKVSLGCELSTYNPLRGGLSPMSRAGWRVFYKPDIVEVRGIDAWSSKAYYDAIATYAIDGRPDTISATDGLFAAWAMELEFPVKVLVVYTHFQEVWWRQNKNFTIQVHPSFDDAKTNVNGIFCATYTGPGLDKPTNFTCPAAYGKAVRIEQFLVEDWASMRMREIKVFA